MLKLTKSLMSTSPLQALLLWLLPALPILVHSKSYALPMQEKKKCFVAFLAAPPSPLLARPPLLFLRLLTLCTVLSLPIQSE